jgi:hypothetical protein
VHSESYRIIAADLDPASDVVLGQYFRSYYAQDAVFRATERVEMGSNRNFTLADLEESLSSQPRSWVTREAW